MHGRLRIVPAAAYTAAAALALGATPATAEITGPCQASINGIDVATRSTDPTSDPIAVKENARVPVTMSAQSPITHLKVQLGFGVFSWTVHDAPSTGTSWARTVDVDDYSRYGVGLYKVTGSSTGPNLSCSGAALVNVEGNPLGTIAGIAGAVLAGLGVAGVIAAFAGNLRAPTVRGRPRRLVLSILAGLVAALGIGTLLQQYAVLYPNTTVTSVLLGLGAAVGIGLPFLGRALGGR